MTQHGVQRDRTFIVSGATSGLGLAVARQMAAIDGVRVVAPARDLERTARLGLGPAVTWVALDLRSLAAVREFAAAWRGRVDGLVNNAGLSSPVLRRTAEGWEETIAVNHLAALQLTLGLLPHLVGGRVVFVGSATHNPDHASARRFGHRGAHFTSMEALARGGDVPGVSAQRLGFDRYATSKLLDTVTAVELARRIAPERTTFFTLDPGMMAGTGLSREMPLVVRALWATVLRWLTPLMPHASTPDRSAAAIVWLLTAEPAPAPSGEVLDFTRRPSRLLWEGARDAELGRAVLDQSLDLLGASIL